MLRRALFNVSKLHRPAATASAKRAFGGAAHSDGPWKAKQEKTNYEYGHPFGFGPNYRWEGYELPTVVLYAVMFWALWDIDTREPEEMPLEEWARNEALAREEAAARGEEIQFGKYYWRPTALTNADMDEWSVERALTPDEE